MKNEIKKKPFKAFSKNFNSGGNIFLTHIDYNYFLSFFNGYLSV